MRATCEPPWSDTLTSKKAPASSGERRPNAARHPDERLMHQEIVAREYIKGRLQAEIADELGLSLATVKRDLAKVRERWLSSTLRNTVVFTWQPRACSNSTQHGRTSIAPQISMVSNENKAAEEVAGSSGSTFVECRRTKLNLTWHSRGKL